MSFEVTQKGNDDVSLWVELNQAQVVQPSCPIQVLQNKRTLLWNHSARLAILLETNLIWQEEELVGSYSKRCYSLGA